MAPRSRVRSDDIRQELEGLAISLGALVDGLPTTPPADIQIWKVYAGTEKAVAKLKLRLAVERPGIFLEIPTSKRAEDLLPMALEGMKDGILKMDEEHLLESLEALRTSRNYLRGYLAEKRKLGMRERRLAAAARRSSARAS